MLIESYVNPNEDTIELHKTNEAWSVLCWNKGDDLMWEVRGVVTSDDGRRQTRRPYTEEEARAEFNRWRT